jgi:hypothetical protein
VPLIRGYDVSRVLGQLERAHCAVPLLTANWTQRAYGKLREPVELPALDAWGTTVASLPEYTCF